MEHADVVRTTFAAREFTDEPMPDEVLYEILDTARFAPSGGNRQPWKVVVVRDAVDRERLVELMLPTARRYLAERMAGKNPWNTIEPSGLGEEDIAKGPDPTPFARQLVSSPVVLLVFADLSKIASFDAKLARVGVISGASIYPFVWNIVTAARNLGWGGTITTFAAGSEPEVQEHFGMPSHLAVAAMVPLGRPTKQLTKLSRGAVEAFATVGRGDGPSFSR